LGHFLSTKKPALGGLGDDMRYVIKAVSMLLLLCVAMDAFSQEHITVYSNKAHPFPVGGANDDAALLTPRTFSPLIDKAGWQELAETDSAFYWYSSMASTDRNDKPNTYWFAFKKAMKDINGNPSLVYVSGGTLHCNGTLPPGNLEMFNAMEFSAPNIGALTQQEGPIAAFPVPKEAIAAAAIKYACAGVTPSPHRSFDIASTKR
jgi:hypothetical protein